MRETKTAFWHQKTHNLTLSQIPIQNIAMLWDSVYRTYRKIMQSFSDRYRESGQACPKTFHEI